MSDYKAILVILNRSVTKLLSAKSKAPMKTQLKAKNKTGRCSAELFINVWNHEKVKSVEQFINTVNALEVDPFTGSSAPGWVVDATATTANSSHAYKRVQAIQKRAKMYASGKGGGTLDGISVPMRKLETGGTYAGASSSNRMTADDWAAQIKEFNQSISPEALMPVKE